MLKESYKIRMGKDYLPSQEPLILYPGDIFFTEPTGPFGRMVLWATNPPSGHEDQGTAHTGIVVDGGLAKDAIIVDSYAFGVRRTKLSKSFGHKAMLLARPLNIPTNDLANIISRAEQAADDRVRYGYIHLFYFLIDALRDKLFKRPLKKRLTNLAKSSEAMVCSRFVSWAFRIRDPDYSFGVEDHLATPNDILDFVLDNLGTKYTIVHPWGKLPNTEG